MWPYLWPVPAIGGDIRECTWRAGAQLPVALELRSAGVVLRFPVQAAAQQLRAPLEPGRRILPKKAFTSVFDAPFKLETTGRVPVMRYLSCASQMGDALAHTLMGARTGSKGCLQRRGVHIETGTPADGLHGMQGMHARGNARVWTVHKPAAAAAWPALAARAGQ